MELRRKYQITEYCHHFLREYIAEGDCCVDATCGNGNDTLMLAKSTAKHVYAFDIQPAAIQSTKALLSEHNIPKEKVTLICDNHTNMTAYLSAARVIMFNLGYLPGSDKSLTTKKYNTINAVNSALSILEKDGLCCIVMYDGHEQGAEEKSALLEMSKNLDSSIYHVAYISMINQQNHPPEILAITKKK